MYAIIEEAGGQRKVLQGEEFLTDLVDEGAAKQGQTIKFDRVLLVGDEGADARIGQPYVPAASVTVEVVEPVVLGDKIDIHKFRAKKGYKRKTGHRQRYTRVKVTAIKA